MPTEGGAREDPLQKHFSDPDAVVDRYAAYPTASGVDPNQVQKARAAVAANLSILSPEHDEAVLRGGGFRNVHLFYTGLVWRGWIAHA